VVKRVLGLVVLMLVCVVNEGAGFEVKVLGYREGFVPANFSNARSFKSYNWPPFADGYVVSFKRVNFKEARLRGVLSGRSVKTLVIGEGCLRLEKIGKMGAGDSVSMLRFENFDFSRSIVFDGLNNLAGLKVVSFFGNVKNIDQAVFSENDTVERVSLGGLGDVGEDEMLKFGEPLMTFKGAKKLVIEVGPGVKQLSFEGYHRGVESGIKEVVFVGNGDMGLVPEGLLKPFVPVTGWQRRRVLVSHKLDIVELSVELSNVENFKVGDGVKVKTVRIKNANKEEEKEFNEGGWGFMVRMEPENLEFDGLIKVRFPEHASFREIANITLREVNSVRFTDVVFIFPDGMLEVAARKRAFAGLLEVFPDHKEVYFKGCRYSLGTRGERRDLGVEEAGVLFGEYYNLLEHDAGSFTMRAQFEEEPKGRGEEEVLPTRGVWRRFIDFLKSIPGGLAWFANWLVGRKV